MKTFAKPLTAGEEAEYLKRWREGDEEARAVLIERNLRLVAHIIKKYQYTDYETEDLLSLYDPIGVDKDGETVNLIDVLEADETAALEEIILAQDVTALYEAFDGCLKETEKLVVRKRYGLFGEKEHTQKEIAGEMGISRSYVSRIEKKAVEKLRRGMECLG